MTAAELLARFPRVKQNGPGDWHVPCPAHDDNVDRPDKFSLHVTETAERLLLHCLAGCDRQRVEAALGITDADLFLHARNGTAPPPSPRPTLAAFAARKHLDPACLLEAGWTETPRGLAIPYRERDGSVWRIRYRTSLAPGQGFQWDGQRDKPLIPYGRWRLDEAIDQGELWLVEGESDTVTAWAHHLPCLGLPGNLAAKALNIEDLVGITTLWIVEEPGQSGRGFLEALRARLHALEYTGVAKVLHFVEKDLSDAHVAHGAALGGQIWVAQQGARPLDVTDPPVAELAPVAAPLCAPLAEGAGVLLARQFPPVEIYIDRILTAEGSGFLAGEEKLGKTYYALDEGASLALALPCCGRFHVPQRRRVLFIEEEDSPRRTQLRLKALLRGRGLEPDDPEVQADFSRYFRQSVWAGFRLDDPDWITWLEANLQDFRPEVVYLDVLRKLTVKDLNKQWEVAPILDVLDRFRRLYECVFRVLHHYRKGQGLRMGRGSQEMGGSYVLGAWAEQSVYLEPIGRKGGGTSFDVQSKDAAANATLRLRWESEGPAHDPVWVRLHLEDQKPDLAPGEKHADTVLQLLETLPPEPSRYGAGVTIKALAAAMKSTPETVRRTLKFLLENGRCSTNEASAYKDRRYFCSTSTETPNVEQRPEQEKLL